MTTYTNQTYNANNTYDSDRPDLKTDGSSVFTLNGCDGATTFENCFFDGGTTHWGFKSTATAKTDADLQIVLNATFNNCVFKDGLERAYDQVRGGYVTFNNCTWINTGVARKRVTNAYTDVSQMCDCGLKGGVFGVTFNNCKINDVLLGDWTIYDQITRPKTRKITFNNCVNPNGGAIIVRGWYADPSTVTSVNTNLTVAIKPTAVTKAYFTYNKYFGDNRKGIPGEFVILPIEWNG